MVPVPLDRSTLRTDHREVHNGTVTAECIDQTWKPNLRREERLAGCISGSFDTPGCVSESRVLPCAGNAPFDV